MGGVSTGRRGRLFESPVAEADHLGVMEVVEKLGLYQEVNEDLAELQKSLFEEGWRDFLKDLKSACPTEL